MFGIVPVKIRGNVNRGDILYASHDTPGVAVSSPSVGFSPSLANDAAAIGVAWRTIGSAYKDEVTAVLMHRLSPAQIKSRSKSNHFSSHPLISNFEQFDKRD